MLAPNKNFYFPFHFYCEWNCFLEVIWWCLVPNVVEMMFGISIEKRENYGVKYFQPLVFVIQQVIIVIKALL